MLSKLLLNFCHNLFTPPLRYFVLLWSFSSTINNCGTFRFYMRIFLVASLVCCSHCNTAQSAMSLSIFPPWGSRKGDDYCDKDGGDDIDGRSMNNTYIFPPWGSLKCGDDGDEDGGEDGVRDGGDDNDVRPLNLFPPWGSRWRRCGCWFW